MVVSNPNVDIFPYELKLMIKGLNNKNRQKIISILKDGNKMSFTEILNIINVKRSLLANHLNVLIECLLLDHFYEHEIGENKYSFYQLSPFGKRIISNLNSSLYNIEKDEYVNIEILKDIDETASRLSELIETSIIDVNFATSMVHPKIIISVMKSIQTGITFRGIYSFNLSDYINIIRRSIINIPNNYKLFKLISDSNNVEVKFNNIPYSFAILDNKYVALELIDPISKKFKSAVIINDSSLSIEYKEIFKRLWNNSEKKSKSLISRILSQ